MTCLHAMSDMVLDLLKSDRGYDLQTRCWRARLDRVGAVAGQTILHDEWLPVAAALAQFHRWMQCRSGSELGMREPEDSLKMGSGVLVVKMRMCP